MSSRFETYPAGAFSLNLLLALTGNPAEWRHATPQLLRQGLNEREECIEGSLGTPHPTLQ